MRIDGVSALFIAVLLLAAILSPRVLAVNDQWFSQRVARRAGVNREMFDVGVEDHMEGGGGPSRSMSNREMQMLLRREGGEEGRGVDCCPSVLEMVEPEGGKNADDMYVELFRDGDKRQRFYELSCRQDVEGKPCRFMDRRLHNQSRCVQKYSYSYAIVRDSLSTADSVDQQRHHHHHHNNNQHLSKSFPSFSSSSGGSDWMLDYIKIRSGCSCEVMPKAKKKRSSTNKGKKTKSKRLSEEDFFT